MAHASPAILYYLTITILGTVQLVWYEDVRANETDAVRIEIRKQIITPETAATEMMRDWSSIESYYQKRNYVPIWSDAGVLNNRAVQLRQTLHVADQEGLNPVDYHTETIDQLWRHPCVGDLAALDILLTDAFFRYALDVHRGRSTPDQEVQKWYIDVPKINVTVLLDLALNSKDFEKYLQQLPPAHLGYQRLREALKKLQRIANSKAWKTMPPGPSLREGMQHAQVPLLRQRLLTDDSLNMRMTKDIHEFDQSLSYAVQRFQVRHGLKMDGVVGPATRAALNVSVQNRIKQVQRNMERWRWLPRTLGNRYIVVNSAAYNLAVIENEQILFTMWVVIGEEQRQTPVVSGTMHTIVFNPYWTVPMKLVFEDLIPAQLKNPKYLQRKNIRVMRNLAKNLDVNPANVDWSAYTVDNFPYVLRQDPGPENPLGRIKFLFSNPFEVYLHDTPKRYLFDKSKRAFSAGCIRIENPLQLADFLLAGNPGWDVARISEAMSVQDTQEVDLKQRIPVYLLYLTSWVGEDDIIYFYDDVYGRDKSLE